MDWRARARTARAQACGPRRRGCGRTRAGARSQTQARPPPTRRKRVRAARMRYRDSSVQVPFFIGYGRYSPVMRGLDPRIHPLRKKALRRWMDCRVVSAFTRVFRRAMPGNDDVNVAPMCPRTDDMFL